MFYESTHTVNYTVLNAPRSVLIFGENKGNELYIVVNVNQQAVYIVCNTIQMAFLPIFHTEWTNSRSSDYAFRFILYGKRQLPIRRTVRKRNVLRSESHIHPSSIHRANNNTCFLVSFGITVLLLY